MGARISVSENPSRFFPMVGALGEYYCFADEFFHVIHVSLIWRDILLNLLQRLKHLCRSRCAVQMRHGAEGLDAFKIDAHFVSPVALMTPLEHQQKQMSTPCSVFLRFIFEWLSDAWGKLRLDTQYRAAQFPEYAP